MSTKELPPPLLPALETLAAALRAAGVQGSPIQLGVSNAAVVALVQAGANSRVQFDTMIPGKLRAFDFARVVIDGIHFEVQSHGRALTAAELAGLAGAA